MKVFEFLIMLRDEWKCIPPSTEGKGNIAPSNSELRRWLKKQSVLLNGKRPGEYDEMEFPVTELVFHPKGNRRCTLV